MRSWEEALNKELVDPQTASAQLFLWNQGHRFALYNFCNFQKLIIWQFRPRSVKVGSVWRTTFMTLQSDTMTLFEGSLKVCCVQLIVLRLQRHKVLVERLEDGARLPQELCSYWRIACAKSSVFLMDRCVNTSDNPVFLHVKFSFQLHHADKRQTQTMLLLWMAELPGSNWCIMWFMVCRTFESTVPSVSTFRRQTHFDWG